MDRGDSSDAPEALSTSLNVAGTAVPRGLGRRPGRPLSRMKGWFTAAVAPRVWGANAGLWASPRFAWGVVAFGIAVVPSRPRLPPAGIRPPAAFFRPRPGLAGVS